MPPSASAPPSSLAPSAGSLSLSVAGAELVSAELELLEDPPQATSASEATIRNRATTAFFIWRNLSQRVDSVIPNYDRTLLRVHYLPVKTGFSPPKKATTPLRRSSVAIESAIPWRSSCRCSVSVCSIEPPARLFAIRT